MTGFTEKTVLITGAAGGIGQEMMRSVAEAGASIGALDRSEDVIDSIKPLLDRGHEACAEVADIADEDAVRDSVAAIRSRLGPINVLINNAGYSGASNLETTRPIKKRITVVQADRCNDNANAVQSMGYSIAVAVRRGVSFGSPKPWRVRIERASGVAMNS